MRFTVRNLAIATLLGGSALLYAGCEAKQQTEYVAGITTQVQVPRDLVALRLDIRIGGAVVHCRTYKVYDGKVQLPRSLGSFSQNGNTGDPVTFTVLGFTQQTEDIDGNPNLRSDECQQATVGQGVRLLRRSRQPYVKDEVLFLPLALKYSCYDVECEDPAATGGKPSGTLTCKGGRCVDAAIDEKTLPRFSPDLVDGTGGNCFPVKECFAAAVPPTVVDAKRCIYAMPNTSSAPKLADGLPPNPFKVPGDGINVRVSYDGGLSEEVLDKDKDEGFTIPDPSKPQQFQLAHGLCDLVRGVVTDDNYEATDVETKHRISALRVSPVCRAKSPFQPLCAGDMLEAMGVDPSGVSGNVPTKSCNAKELKPARAALMVLVDDTKNSSAFFTGGSSAENTADKVVLELSLQDPAFSKTDIGMMYFPGNGTCAPNPAGFSPAVPLQLASKAQVAISADFKAHTASLKPENAPVNMSGALDFAYNALTQANADSKYHQLGVLVIGNRGFAANECGKTPAASAAAAAASGIKTYALLLTGLNENPEGYQAVGLAGNAEARKASDKQNAFGVQQSIVKELASCVYDFSGEPSQEATLSFNNPFEANPANATRTASFNAACNSNTSTAEGWGIQKNGAKTLIRLCGAPCDAYRTALAQSVAFALSNTPAPPAQAQPPVPIPVFLHDKTCGPTKALPSGGGGGGGGADSGTPTPDAGPKDAGADSGSGDGGGGIDAGVDAAAFQK